MAFLIFIALIVTGLLISLGLGNRRRHRQLATSTRRSHRKQLVQLAKQSGLKLQHVDNAARLTGTHEGRTLTLSALSGGGIGAESEVDLELFLPLRHPLPTDSQIWKRGGASPPRTTGRTMHGPTGLMLRTSQSRELSLLLSRPGTIAALETFFSLHPSAFITDNAICLRRRWFRVMPERLLSDAATLAGVLEEGIEVPWLTVLYR